MAIAYIVLAESGSSLENGHFKWINLNVFKCDVINNLQVTHIHLLFDI